jgi:hypothetical protein
MGARTVKISKLESGKASAAGRKKKTPPGKGGEFAERLREAAGVADAPEAVEPTKVDAVDVVFSVQEANGATDERSRGLTRQYGEDILSRLEKLRNGLLDGEVAKEDLAGLAQKMRAQKRLTEDPKLGEIIDEIELRAEVEIAKLTRGP